MARVGSWRARLEGPEAGLGTVVALQADHSPESFAVLLALLAGGRIVVLAGPALSQERPALYETAQVGSEIRIDGEGRATLAPVGRRLEHPLLRRLAAAGTGGLVLFTSGSAGRSKAVVHDAARLLAKYRTPRRASRTVPFMLFDHIGGLNTALHTLSSGGTLVVAPDRSPAAVCRLIEAHRVQVLPASPTFVKLLLLTDLARYDLASLEVLAYGAERMPAPTLARLRAALGHVRLVQSYGLSEVGILRSESESSDSLWVRLGGDGVSTRVRDGLLEIKADGAMLGYLDEPSPVTDDGWLRTGDRVEVRGGYIRILGRASDVIVVGGEKVSPAEVEDQLLALPGVVEAVVFAEPNALTGQAVAARVRLSAPETRGSFRRRMRPALTSRLAEFKVPARIEVSDTPLHSPRWKRAR